jgi:hypothetical protein
VALVEPVFNDKLKASSFIVTLRRPGSDELVWSMPLFTAEEVSALKASSSAAQELDEKVLERIRQVNDFLGQTKWVTLAEQAIVPRVTEACQQVPEQSVQLGARQLLYQQGHLRWEDGTNPPVDWDAPDAGTSADASTSGGIACDAVSRRFIDAAYTDAATGTVLLRFASCGDKSCPEVFSGHHAFKWH